MNRNKEMGKSRIIKYLEKVYCRDKGKNFERKGDGI